MSTQWGGGWTTSIAVHALLRFPEIQRNAASSRERHWQLTDELHPLFGHAPAKSRLKSRKSFVNAVNPSVVVEDYST